VNAGEIEYVEPDLDVVFGTRPYWRIAGPPDVMIRLKRIFPRAETYRKDWITLDHTAEVARDIEWISERWDFEIAEEDRDLLREAALDHRDRQDAIGEILAGGRNRLDFPRQPAREPFDYQTVAANLARASRGLLLGDELGLGKSTSLLLVLLDPELLPALIVVPTHLPKQWVKEVLLNVPWLKTHIIRTGTAYDPKRRREMKGEDPDVLIVNYHKIRGWADHLAGRIRCVLFDEVQELRRAESEKYKAAARIADGADVRVGASATPIYNYAGEIHNVMSVLAPDILGSREEFAREWGSGYWHEKLRVSDPKALGIYLRTQGVYLSRTWEDVGRKRPEALHIPWEVESDGDVYDGLMANAGKLIDRVLSGDRKESFLASGQLDLQIRQATGIAKAPYVAAFVKMLLESERKIVMFGWHREVYRIWLELLAPFNPVLYTGSESPRQKEASKQRFMAHTDDPETECRLLMMSLRSGSGLDDLQLVSHICVFGELDWSPGIHRQCIGRLRRGGQEHDPVLAYFLNSGHGSDPEMIQVLNAKLSEQIPIENPDYKIVESAGEVTGHVRKLAEQIKSKRIRR
jgi:hypothetical protein